MVELKIDLKLQKIPSKFLNMHTSIGNNLAAYENDLCSWIL